VCVAAEKALVSKLLVKLQGSFRLRLFDGYDFKLGREGPSKGEESAEAPSVEAALTQTLTTKAVRFASAATNPNNASLRKPRTANQVT
jgi:hypothetical protein